jgi:hypothetical protein
MNYGEENPVMEQLMCCPAEAAQILGICRTRVFALIKSGRTPGPAPGSDEPWT